MMNRRSLPASCDPASPDIEMLPMLRATDAQWAALERVVRGAERLLALGLDGDAVTFRIQTRDGREQTGSIDEASATITRDTPTPVA